MSAFDGGFKGSMQHPPRASNRNTNSMLNLYLFKGRDCTVTFTRSNQDSRRLWRTVGKPWVSKACPLLRAVLRLPVEPATQNSHSHCLLIRVVASSQSSHNRTGPDPRCRIAFPFLS